MVLTDPEFESSVLISTDEGASYQKYRLNFYLLSLLFHPTEEDWALAYSHDQKVRSLSSFFCPHLKLALCSLLATFCAAHIPYCRFFNLANYLMAFTHPMNVI